MDKWFTEEGILVFKALTMKRSIFKQIKRDGADIDSIFGYVLEPAEYAVHHLTFIAEKDGALVVIDSYADRMSTFDSAVQILKDERVSQGEMYSPSDMYDQVYAQVQKATQQIFLT